jgi:hypothetical protein
MLSACGAARDDGGSSEAGATAEGADSPVVTVSVHQSGGLKPTDEIRVFSADAKPPAGFTERDVEAVLDAADALAASHVTTPRLPTGSCADCYLYDITLLFADGSTAHYSFAGGTPQPKPLSDLLAAAS